MDSFVSSKKPDSLGKTDFRAKRSAMKYATPKGACSYIWRRLFDSIRPGDTWPDVIIWEIGVRTKVRPTPACVDESNHKFRSAVHWEFEDAKYKQELKLTARIKNKAEARTAEKALNDEFYEAIFNAIIESFQLKDIQKDFSKFNGDGKPFTIIATTTDEGLHATDFEVLWHNKTGADLKKLKRLIRSAKGKSLPPPNTQPSEAERRMARLSRERKAENARIKEWRAKKAAKEQADLAEKAKRKMPARKVELTPKLYFLADSVHARCRTMWMRLFELLYEFSISAQSVSSVVWEVNADRSIVQLLPKATVECASDAPWKTPPMVQFSVGEFLPQFKALKGTVNAKNRNTLLIQFKDWIATAVVSAFESEAVQVEYSWFNEDDHPFSTFVTLTAEKKRTQPTLLWSNTRKVQLPVSKAKPAKLPPSVKSVDYSAAGWQRFYFDDGMTRCFWYIHCKGASQTIVQGDIASKGTTRSKKLASPKAALASTEQLVQTKLAKGFIPYDTSVKYRRANKPKAAAVRKALADFEQERGYRVCEDFRTYLLAVNGGDLPEDSFVTLPRNPLKKMNVHRIFGMAVKNDYDVVYSTARQYYAEGQTLFAQGYYEFTIDAHGVIHMPDMEQIDRADYDDDGIRYGARLPTFIVAHSLDEFLTRIKRFPDDTSGTARTLPSPQFVVPASGDEASHLMDTAMKAAAAQPFRRFFFDDGKQQKFWHIKTGGKKFTTSCGRFGASPTETTKSFSSGSERIQASDRIITQKVKKGYREVLPDALPILRPERFRRATSAAITKLEKQIGFRLPDQYRQFLQNQNGGVPSPRYVNIPGEPYIDCVGVDYVLGLYPKAIALKSLSWAIDEGSRILPTDHLPIAYGSDWFTLSLKTKPGCVFFWNHESDEIDEEDPNDRFLPSAGHLLANSFDEFLTRIATATSG